MYGLSTDSECFFKGALWCALIEIVHKAWLNVEIFFRERAMEDCEFVTLCTCNNRGVVMNRPSIWWLGLLEETLDCPGRYCGRIGPDSVNGSCYSDCGVSLNAFTSHTTRPSCVHTWLTAPKPPDIPWDICTRKLRIHVTWQAFHPTCPVSSPPHFYCVQACPTGYRVDQNTSECLPCGDPAVLRDYLFLGFVCLVCVAVRLSVIAATTVGKPQLAVKL